MMRQLLLLLISQFILVGLSAQISFEQGYFIDNEGTKTICSIKNIDWRNNPSSITYRFDDNSPSVKTLDQIQEFGIDGISKYTRSVIQLDMSSTNINNLSFDKNPEFVQDTVLLKVLVEGEATLYSYTDKSIVQYFYKVNDSDIEPLIHKKYRLDVNKIRTNYQFRQQLSNAINCHSLSSKDLLEIEYKKKDLEFYFTEFNNCVGSEMVKYDNSNKTQTKFSIRPGLNFAMLNTTGDFDYGTNITYRIGAELEHTLPFNRNKWAVFVEPTFQQLNAGITIMSVERNITYSTIEIPFGIRHYFFLKRGQKLFINILGAFDIPLGDSRVDIPRRGSDVEITSSTNLGIGVGFDSGKKLSLELRYQRPRDLVPFILADADYSQLSIIVGYQLIQ